MKKVRVYIAFLLMIILLFPLIYQGLHVWGGHHAHTHTHIHEQKTQATHSAQISENEDPCPICTFEFVQSVLKTLPSGLQTPSIYANILIEFCVKISTLQAPLLLLLRGPPQI